MDPSRLPFYIKSLYAGCARLNGMLIVSPEQLTVEFQVTDTLLGVFNGPVTTHTIAVSDLQQAECGLGLFAPWLLLTARTLKAFEKLPRIASGQVCFRVAWKHRRQLRAITSEINLNMSFRDADRYRDRLPGRV